MGFIDGADRNQIVLFPECMDDYIDEGSVVRIIDEYIESIDMKKLGFKSVEAAPTGRPGYRNQDIAKLYVYGYMNRIRSSRKLECEAIRNIEVIWLLKKTET